MAEINETLKRDPKIDFFKFDLHAEEQQKVFADIFSQHKGNWSAIKSELTGKEGFADEVINKLEFTHQLSMWSDNNPALVSLFQEDEQTNSLRDIALTLDKTAFIDKVKTAALGESDEEKHAFAINLRRDLFKLEPTALLVNMVKDAKVPFLNDAVGANIAAVLTKQPDFNIKTTSVYELIKNEEAFKDISTDAQEAVKIQLKTLQRITAVSPDPDAVPVLYNAKIQSAMQISALPKAQFIAALRESDLDENTLAQIHHNAQQTQVRNEHFLMSVREAAQPTGVAMIDKSLGAYVHPQAHVFRPVGAAVVAEKPREEYAKEMIIKNNLSWDLLFGDADFCECGECNSVYSPSSYFVELLNYLRNNNLDPDATGPIKIKPDPKDISGTPLGKLFERRPDLGCLELTCQNTNTLIPYVDLVNEVMENYVAFKKLKPFNVDDETSSELLAEPQYTEYKAYCILKNEVYPFTLPYHQPIDAARIYLNFLDTSRHELIDTFRKNNASDDAELTKLKDEALDRAADAEYLGLTKEEYVILTKDCFESKALMDKLKNKHHTDDEYRALIGVKPVHEYYGYADEDSMLGSTGLTLIKKEFLRRTGIDYFNLVDLLKTETINPCMPKGRAKAIMESLRFSYRFLQNYTKIHGIDKMAEDLVKMEKFADLAPLIKEQIGLLTGKKALSCPKPCDDEVEICDRDIICWVKCYFEKIGKMIVIESGRGCVDGKILTNDDSLRRWTPPITIVRDCKIFIQIIGVAGMVENEVGSIDRSTGKVTVKAPADPQNPVDPKDYKNLLFIGDKGEKGIFLVIENEVYLVLIEQKDSCNLDTALLQHLDGTPLTVPEYDKIHRFIRLWRKLGWTINEIDKAIIGLSASKTSSSKDGSLPAESLCDENSSDDCADVGGNCGDCEDCAEDICIEVFDINPRLIHQLVAVNKLLDKTGLELIKLLCFWTSISTSGEKSLYQRLFLTHNILGIDKIFKADETGNYLTAETKLLDHLPAVMAALNLSSDDIQAIMQATGMEDELTLGNLSLLYRYRLLSKVLGLRIPAFLSILPLFGDIFKDADASFEFMARWLEMEDAGFTHQQLNYIIKNFDDEKKPFTPSQKTVLLLSKTLYDGLNAIDEAHKDLVADPTITDPEQKKINIQEQATGDSIRTKASLLFDNGIVDKLIAFLEGTSVYTTNAPKNLEFTLPDTKTLKTKLKYDKTLGVIQISGILTATEAADFYAISNDAGWKDALERIQKQQAKLFKELLAGVFEEEKTKTAVEKAQLESIMKQGDVVVPLEKIPQGDPDPNTAPQKRVAFLEIFLPYLRQQLTHRFVIDTLAGFAELEGKVTDVLASNILMLGTPAEPIYNIFEKIKDSSQPAETNWSGYVIPAIDTSYRFIVKHSSDKDGKPVSPLMSLDGVSLVFEQQDDPNDEYWSEAKLLQAGKLYKLVTTGVELKNVFWKTPASAIVAIPSSALIPDFASERCGPALIALKKAAMLVSGFALSADEIQFLDDHKIEFESLDFNALTLEQWLRLEAYTRLRNTLSQTKINILDFWHWIYDTASEAAKLSEKITELTAWKKDRVDKLIATDHFNIGKLADYHNEKNLLKLQKALKVADKIGMDINLLFDLAIPTSRFNKCHIIAASIKNAIRARYNQTDWEQVVKPLNDQLRNHQRDALTAYLLQQPELIAWNVVDADGLFEYFLIDVQMDACMETSRIKQAISSVQLFIQRCFLGLESKLDKNGIEIGIASDILDRNRWEWMQPYRVWEANRKVWLYPENWIESNLRDDKSPFFKELESELLQKDINKQNVTDALKSYLYKVDEVANMEVIGLYIDGTRSTSSDGKVNWTEYAKLHVFARTRNAPYIFYYRYLALDEMNWYPWEKMQVDIPVYDNYYRENDNEIMLNGCYLSPIVWNNRLLVFFPQIIKKAKPKIVTGNNNQELTIKEQGEQKKPSESAPIEYFEIKMGWSEYRAGKWTPKQLSKEVINHIPEAFPIEYGLSNYEFVPALSDDNEKLLGIRVFWNPFNPSPNVAEIGKFEFNGNNLQTPVKTYSLDNQIITNKFHYYEDDIYPLQSDFNFINWYFFHKNKLGHTELLESINVSIAPRFIAKFYFSNSHDLLGKVNLGQIKEFFEYNLEIDSKEFGLFDHDDDTGTPDIHHELKLPHSLYIWELFFHTLILLADALSEAQKFEEAMKWFHFVFNPIAGGNEDNRFWQFKPFKEIDSKRILDSIFINLKPNTADKAINEWRTKPFMPHVVARSRPVAYMKWVVMKYIDNLLAWGDHLFRQDTIETINQATQLYVLASHILGPKPMMIPKRGKIKPQTYLGLLDKWDAFGNAMVELELAAPFSNQTTLPVGVINKEIVFANIFGIASSLYFCIPNNPKLMGYWDTLADRLYKIRHCLNIEGVFRKLPLFEPPIDPALLVKAAAQGLSIASVLNDLNTPMPNYRFYYLLQKALELCNELKSLGGAMLSAIEKKDNETIALIRAKHENVMQNLVMEIKKKQLEEAQKNIESLQQNRKAPEERMKYYLKLSGLDESLVPDNTAEFNGIPNDIVTVDGDSGLKLIPFEKEDMDKASEANNKQKEVTPIERMVSILNAIPSLSVNVQPFGIGLSTSFGGANIGSIEQARARVMQGNVSDFTFQSSNAGKKGGFTRAIQERIFQANAAGYELKQIDKQITAQEIRINIANQEITNQQKAIDNANEIEEFLKNKFTNEELYTWMRGNLKTLYHQVYKLAYDLAKKAEKTYCFERGISSANFIQAGYFDAGYEGLLAGEQLYVGLKQLEAAYQNERGYDYEITKHVSLYQLDPLALIHLRETGKCEFMIPEAIFDLDFPGHYKRRIKSVSLSIPCVAGPYTGVNATLTLLENKFRNTAIGGQSYEENIEETDERFSTYRIPINAIAVSSAQNDSGLFELNFKDERYLPFEGAGVISKWRLELPVIRQFDYQTISDTIIHLKYTANEGGERLKAAASKSLSKQLGNITQALNETGLHVALSMRHDLPNEWYLLKKNGSIDLKFEKARLPYMMQIIDKPSIDEVMLLAQIKDDPSSYSIRIDGSAVDLAKISNELKLCHGNTEYINLDKTFNVSIEADQIEKLEELILVIKYGSNEF